MKIYSILIKYHNIIHLKIYLLKKKKNIKEYKGEEKKKLILKIFVMNYQSVAFFLLLMIKKK